MVDLIEIMEQQCSLSLKIRWNNFWIFIQYCNHGLIQFNATHHIKWKPSKLQTLIINRQNLQQKSGMPTIKMVQTMVKVQALNLKQKDIKSSVCDYSDIYSRNEWYTQQTHHNESTLIRWWYYVDMSKGKYRQISTSFQCTL